MKIKDEFWLDGACYSVTAIAKGDEGELVIRASEDTSLEQMIKYKEINVKRLEEDAERLREELDNTKIAIRHYKEDLERDKRELDRVRGVSGLKHQAYKIGLDHIE